MFSTTFVLLSFEGPDPYSSSGGLAGRTCGLATELAAMGHETHLFFIGDPFLPPAEVRHDGRLHLHRWCQWISEYHPAGVYDGEEGKVADWTASLPEWVADNVIADKVAAGGNVVVLAEEWQTAPSVIALRRLVDERGWAGRVYLLWNANDARRPDRVPWSELKGAAFITTVSRYMRAVLDAYGVQARVVPTGVADEWLLPISEPGLALRNAASERTIIAKPDPWDAEGWWLAMDAVAAMERMGMRPLLVGEGQVPKEVDRGAVERGLRVVRRTVPRPSIGAMSEALLPYPEADVLIFENGLTTAQRQVVFRTATAVLASAAREPFGTTGLQAMASGGVAMVGCSGEDYATPGFDSLALQTADPREVVHHVAVLQDSPAKAASIRRNARLTAARYTWDAVVRRCLLPTLSAIGVPRVEVDRPTRVTLEGRLPARSRGGRMDRATLAQV